MKKNNIFFLTTLLIFFVIGLFPLLHKNKAVSLIENRKLSVFHTFSLSSYLKKTYQKNIETTMSDQFIFSEEIKSNFDKLYNISIFSKIKQIYCKDRYISLGNSRYTFDCKDYIVFSPTVADKYSLNTLLENIRLYSKFNQEIDTSYYFIPTSEVFDFKTNTFSYNIPKYIKENMKNNYHFSYLKFTDFTTYQKYFYKTDHHWNYQGSYQGYKDIIKMLAPNDEIKKPIKKYSFPQLYFFGSHAHFTKNYEFMDSFKAYKFDIAKHDTYINGKKAIYGNQEDFFIGKYPQGKYPNYYTLFYGDDYALVEYHFNQKEKDNLLIIANSYSDPIKELIASHFNNSYFIDFRFYLDTFNQPLNIRNFIKENDIDRVLFLLVEKA